MDLGNAGSRLMEIATQKQAKSDVHKIVNAYYKMRGWDKLPKEDYKDPRKAYGRLSAEAKAVYKKAGSYEEAMSMLDKMNYYATKGEFDWTIRTCLKYKPK